SSGRDRRGRHRAACGARWPGRAAAPLLLVPYPLDAPAVASEPAAGPEGEAHVDAQAVVGSPGGDVLAGPADLHHRGHAAAQHLGHGEVDARARRLLVLGGAADGQELEEARVEELRIAAVLVYT